VSAAASSISGSSSQGEAQAPSPPLPPCSPPAGVELALAADVEEPRAERDCGGQAGEDQRRRAGQRLGPRETRAEAAFEQQRIGLSDRCTGPGDQQRGHGQREEQRPGRGGHQQ
jgi:hypothetical protein